MNQITRKQKYCSRKQSCSSKPSSCSFSCKRYRNSWTFRQHYRLYQNNHNHAYPLPQFRRNYLTALPNPISTKLFRPFFAHDFNTALHKLIEELWVDRMYLNEFAKEACIALFNYLGESNGSHGEIPPYI